MSEKKSECWRKQYGEYKSIWRPQGPRLYVRRYDSREGLESSFTISMNFLQRVDFLQEYFQFNCT